MTGDLFIENTVNGLGPIRGKGILVIEEAKTSFWSTVHRKWTIYHKLESPKSTALRLTLK